jgi:hypothetical protein
LVGRSVGRSVGRPAVKNWTLGIPDFETKYFAERSLIM